ncbi:transglycosylase SLT domain-containing protein [Rhodococcus sp. D2-41]|uniref:transglycosylase SLT domain-containing protein n=1 Tax=Speluncibacter jeojiensis TaxID=2710754 RepID=UPI00240EA832|nr:transglycosylase SLT domain-containing protein [Rhodococcus sp. D2-41]MDG3012454.1 transglycosylase SLT domain-containing protein [Rhodococcus sp. D2-41]
MTTYSAGSAAVTIRPDLRGFQRAMTAELRRVNADAPVSVVPDLAGFSERLKADLQRITAEVPVAVVPDLSGFGDRLKADLQRINAEAPVSVVPDLSGFAERLRTELAAINATMTVGINVDEAAARVQLEQLRQAGGTIRMRVDVDHSVLSQLTNNLGSARGAADGAGESMRGLSAIKFGGTIAAVGSLIAALGGLVGVAGGAAAGLGAIGAAGVIGSTGVVNAFSEMKKASDTSTSTQESNAKAVRSANESLSDAMENAARTQVRGQQQIESAERNVQSAQRNSIQAQRDLSTARKDAKAQIDSLNDSLRSSALGEQEAEIAVQRAYEAMVKSRSDGSSGLDQKQANVDYERAVLNLQEARKRTQELQQQTQEANTAGVEGSKQVLDAKQKIADADEKSRDAVNQLKTTQTEAAQSNSDAAKQVSRAQQGVADAIESGQSAANGLADAMANLSPNAQAFVQSMQALGPQWKDLRMAVQDNLFAGLGDSVTTLATNQLPLLGGVLGSVATSINGAVKDSVSSLDATLTQLGNSGAFAQLTAGVDQALQGMAPLLTGVVTALTDLGGQVLPSLGPLFASLGGALQTMAPALGTLGASLADTLTPVMPVLAQLISSLASGLAPVLPVIGELLTALGTALMPLIPPLSDMLQIIGTALGDAIVALTPAIGPLAQAIVSIVDAISPLLPLAGELIGKLVEALAPALTTIAQALQPVIEQFANALQPVLAVLIPIIGQVAQVLAQVLVQALQALSPLLVQIGPLFAQLLTALMPLLPPILDLAMKLLPPLVQIIQSLFPVVVTAIQIFTQLVNLLMPILIPVIEKLGDIVATVAQKLADLISWAIDKVVMPTLRALKDFLTNGVGPVFSWLYDNVVKPVWDKISSAIDLAWNRVIKPAWDALKDGMTGVGSVMHSVADTIGRIWDGILNTIRNAVRTVGGLLKKVPGFIPGSDKAHDLGNALVDWANKKASGGKIVGPGGPRDDVIPALLSNGEFVVNAAATSRNLPLLEALNSNRFADGGRVALSRAQAYAQSHDGEDYDYGGANGGVDCSLYTSGVTAALLDRDPGVRLFNTESDFPQLGFQEGSDKDGWSIGIHRGGGGPNSHMAGTLAGVNVESSGAGVHYGPGAAGADDPQFELHYFLPRNLWSPPDTGGDGGVAGLKGVPSPGNYGGTGGSQVSMPSGGYTPAPGGYPSTSPTTAGAGTGTDTGGPDLSGSISDAFGNAAKAFVTGQISDALGTVGVNDEVPPIVQLGAGLLQGKYRTPPPAPKDSGSGQYAPGAAPLLPKAGTAPALPSGGGAWTPHEAPKLGAATPDPSEAGVVKYDPAGGAEQWRGLVQSVFEQAGWNSDKPTVNAVIGQIQIESSGDPNAQNNTDSNAVAADPSVGLLQVIRSTFESYRSTQYPDDQRDPAANIYAAANYVISDPKFGGRGIAGVWPTTAGYATGGPVIGPGTGTSDSIPALLSNGEFVVNALAARANMPLLEAINSGSAQMAAGGVLAARVSVPQQATAASPQRAVEEHVHYHVADMDEAIRKERTRQKQDALTFAPRRG